MLRLVVFACALLLPTLAISQEEAPPQDAQRTLFGSGDLDIGGFGGPVLKLTSLADQTALLIGGRGGVLLGKSFWIGAGGLGVVNDVEIERLPGDGRDATSFSYGGPMVGFVILSDALVHAEINALVGGGSVGFRRPDGLDEDGEPDYDTDSDAFFVVEPEINVEVNLLRFLRVGAGLSWRFLGGIDTGNWENGDFDGIAGQLFLKLGSF